MKKIILSFLLFSFGIFGISSAEVKPFEALELADFKKEIKNSIVIDVRTPGEIILGKITKDALEMDFYEEKKFKEDLNKLDKTKQYLIYCRSGNRSDSTKSIMKDLGFSNVNDLDGGIIIWDEKLFGAPNKDDVVKKYLGKPTVVMLAGTFCPHCQKDVPEVEKEIFNKVGNQINLVVNVTDGEGGKRFKTNMEQIVDPLLNYKTLVGKECAYVPTWIVLDKDGDVADESCGNGKKTAGIVSSLTDLGVTFDKIRVKTDEEKEEDKKNTIIFWVIIALVMGGGFWAFRK